MNVANLREYLSIVTDLEKEKYLQERCIEEMTEQANSISPEYPQEIKEPQSRKGIVALALALSIFCSIPIVLITILVFIFGDARLALFLIISDLIAFIVFIVLMLFTKAKDAKLEREYTRAMQSYHADCKNRDLEISNINADVRRRKAIILKQIEYMESVHKQTCDVLQSAYDKNIIFPKYRNLPMVCSIYEYITSGRCETLEGHEGAYNILEMEVRMDRIILRLDLVIEKLSAIQSSQYMLYSAIKESQNMLAELTSETKRLSKSTQALGRTMEQGYREINGTLNKIAVSSAITSYAAQQSQKELHYMNRMNYLTGKNDGVLFNAPPN